MVEDDRTVGAGDASVDGVEGCCWLFGAGWMALGPGCCLKMGS